MVTALRQYMLLMQARHQLLEAQRTVLHLAGQLKQTECHAPLMAAAFCVGAAADRLDVLSGLPGQSPAAALAAPAPTPRSAA